MKHIYISACDKSGGIYHYTFENGRLTFCEKTELDRPMYTVASGGRLYALRRYLEGDSGAGALLSYKINQDGALCEPTEPLSSRGEVPCHLCTENGIVYAVNYVSGSIIKFPDKTVAHSGHGPHPTRQTKAHTHFISLSPDKKYLLCTDLGLDTVFVYDTELNMISSAKVPAGSGCRHLCFAGELVYCINELTSDVSVFRLENGELTYLNTYAAIPDFAGESTAAAIRIYEGRLYVSHRGADCISCFDIQGEALKLLWNAECGGKNPRDFDITDGYIICTNEGGNISVLKLFDDGAQLVTDDIELPDPLCVTVVNEGDVL